MSLASSAPIYYRPPGIYSIIPWTTWIISSGNPTLCCLLNVAYASPIRTLAGSALWHSSHTAVSLAGYDQFQKCNPVSLWIVKGHRGMKRLVKICFWYCKRNIKVVFMVKNAQDFIELFLPLLHGFGWFSLFAFFFPHNIFYLFESFMFPNLTL